MSEANESLEEFLFEAAVQRASAGERAAFLDGVCQGNPGLRARLDALLEGHFQAEGFLNQQPKPESKPEAKRPPPRGESDSRWIGRYKLLEKLGEGGFGEVWMAEQKEPVKRRVALKIIKLGMDTRQVVARFEGERQALAMMDHPNIAKMLDAGATETGRPYFVMELVRGLRITEYCDQNQLPTRERLRLFIQVCRAIQHAHQKGIIHRDIKPSNILVTLHDGVPVPKVIDFGIAKATQQELTERTVFTQFRQFLGTPAYISPEQAEMSGLDVDTRSDIYSLGVLLYELLTGRTPFDTQELLKAGLDELRRAIRETEPARPSTRLSSMPQPELTTTARQRGAEAPKLISLVRGDLDWTVMKCLEKDRTRRYETAHALARDLERHLNHEPVLARPRSPVYEFRKTVQRHKAGFAATASVVVALAAGVVVSTREAMHARRAEGEQGRLRQEAVKVAAREANAHAIAEQRLYDARLSEARAKRLGGVAGDRFEALAAIADAASIRESRELSDEAVACLALTDLRVHKTFPLPSRAVAEQVVFDERLELYAYETAGGITVRRASNDQQTAFLPLAQANPQVPVLADLWFDPLSRFLCARVQYGDGAGRWRVWRLTASGQPALEVAGDYVAFSPDGQRLVIATDDGAITIRDLESSKEVRRFSIDVRLFQFCFSPDGRRLAGFQDGSSSGPIWDVASGQLLASFPVPERISSVGWSSDGSMLAYGDYRGGISFWDVRREEARLRWQGHRGRVVSVAFDHGGKVFASSGWDATTRLWEVPSGEPLAVYQTGTSSLRFSPDDRVLAAAYDGPHCRLLEVVYPTGYRRLNCLYGSTDLWDLDLTPDWRVAAVTSSRGTQLVDVFAGQNLGLVDAGGDRSVHLDSLGSLGLWTATASGLRHRLLRYATSGGQAILRAEPPKGLLSGTPVLRLAFAPDAKRAAATRRHGAGLLLLNLEDSRTVSRFCAHPGAHYVAIDPAGQWAASGTWKGEGVKVWDFSTGQLIRDLPVRGSAALASSPDGRWLATANASEYRLWDTKSWSPGPGVLAANPVFQTGALAFSPDSRLLATCHGDAQIQIVRVPTLELVARLLLAPGSNLGTLRFNPSGDKLAALEWTGTIHLWDLRAIRTELQRLNLDWDLPPLGAAADVPPTRGRALQLDAGPFSRQELAEAIPARDTKAPGNLIDLTDYYNAPLTAGWHSPPEERNDLAALPRGLQTFAGVQFDVRGLIQIGLRAANGLTYPGQVLGIPIGRCCRRLHFLHAATSASGARDGDELGSYIIHYVDGRRVEIPILTGRDMADWWSQPGEEKMRFVIAWKGENAPTRAAGRTIRLFKSTWENPYPETRVRCLDFVSDKPTPGQPFLVALTAEP